jgi:hypothetical protein
MPAPATAPAAMADLARTERQDIVGTTLLLVIFDFPYTGYELSKWDLLRFTIRREITDA